MAGRLQRPPQVSLVAHVGRSGDGGCGCGCGCGCADMAVGRRAVRGLRSAHRRGHGHGHGHGLVGRSSVRGRRGRRLQGSSQVSKDPVQSRLHLPRDHGEVVEQIREGRHLVLVRRQPRRGPVGRIGRPRGLWRRGEEWDGLGRAEERLGDEVDEPLGRVQRVRVPDDIVQELRGVEVLEACGSSRSVSERRLACSLRTLPPHLYRCTRRRP
jgi:hypothetical protein